MMILVTKIRNLRNVLPNRHLKIMVVYTVHYEIEFFYQEYVLFLFCARKCELTIICLILSCFDV